MILWINGTFGVGKTTASARLADSLHNFRQFDPESVGYMLANSLGDVPVNDFQEYPAWRRLVPVVADEIVSATAQHLVAAQSVLVEDYWLELREGLVGLGHEVFHVVLDVDSDSLHARIDADVVEPDHIRPWRHRHVDLYESSRSWLTGAADLVVDTVSLDASETAACIHAAINKIG